MLVADDDPDLRQLLATAMRLNGYEVLSASNGVDALAELDRGGIDLAVLDVFMPGLTGLAVVRALRGRTGIDQPAVLLLSAGFQPKDVVEALHDGADAFLHKPFSLAGLREQAGTLLEERQSRDGGPAADAPAAAQRLRQADSHDAPDEGS